MICNLGVAYRLAVLKIFSKGVSCITGILQKKRFLCKTNALRLAKKIGIFKVFKLLNPVRE